MLTPCPSAESAEAYLPTHKASGEHPVRIRPRPYAVPARQSALAFLHAGVVFCVGGSMLVFKGLIGYKYFLEVKEMKSKRFWTILFLSGSLLILFALPSHAQKLPRTLTILYSNNLNGEIDPCPT